MAERQVDDPGRDLYLGRARDRRADLFRSAGRILLVVLFVGCSGRSSGTPLTAPPEEIREEVERATRPETPVRIIFGWNLNEEGTRLEGRGVTRMEPPYRVRLDLFTENGETAARAALVDGTLRLPPEVDRRLLPPPALLWASVGVFHPGDEAEVVGGQEEPEGVVRLHLELPDGAELRYSLRDGVIQTAELLEDGYVVERVRLTWGDRPFPADARYRNLAEFRELRVTLESVERVESFSPDIWRPGG